MPVLVNMGHIVDECSFATFAFLAKVVDLKPVEKPVEGVYDHAAPLHFFDAMQEDIFGKKKVSE